MRHRIDYVSQDLGVARLVVPGLEVADFRAADAKQDAQDFDAPGALGQLRIEARAALFDEAEMETRRIGDRLNEIAAVRGVVRVGAGNGGVLACGEGGKGLRKTIATEVVRSPPSDRPADLAPRCAQESMLSCMLAADRGARARVLSHPSSQLSERAQHLSLSLKETCIKEPIKRAVPPQQLGSALRPDPAAPGNLSEESPLSAMKSGTWFASTPYRCRTSSGPMRASSPPGDG
jgi:hypothetical protein